MPDNAPDEQILKYLTDAHSIEVQALEQMRLAPKIADEPSLSAIYAEHFTETQEHERLVRAELQRRGASASAIKDVAGRAGGWGMVLFAKLNPDTPGKLAMHSYSYEHMELAAYELLRRVADRVGDTAASDLAQRIGGDERRMADRVAEHWDAAVDASLRAKDADATRDQIVKYLRDAYALEAQAIQMLEAGPKIAEFDDLARLFEEHLEESRGHQRLVETRLRELDATPSRIQAAAMRMSALNLGGFFKAQPDSPVKIAGFAYAFEALEVGAYELLARTARRAGDAATAAMAEQILANEQATAERVAQTWDAAADAALAQQTASG
jgi:ferritin-like metal-binding protein YciE